MAKKRVFISFDYDNDNDIRNALVGQAKYPNSPFEIVDASVRRHLTGDWKKKARDRIRRADLMTVMCGEHTHEAEGVAIEVKIAQEEGVEYFLLRGHKDRVCTKPVTALKNDVMHDWTWENLRKLIEGKTLAESVDEWLNSPTPWLIAGAGLALWILSRKERSQGVQSRQFAGNPYRRTWPEYPQVGTGGTDGRHQERIHQL